MDRGLEREAENLQSQEGENRIRGQAKPLDKRHRDEEVDGFWLEGNKEFKGAPARVVSTSRGSDAQH